MPSGKVFRGVFLGSQSLLLRCAEHFLERGHELTALVTADSSVHRWAKSRGIDCFAPAKDLVDRLASNPFDLLFSVIHLALVPAAVLRLPRIAAINFHDGPLPQYAGLHVPSWALLNRESEHGVTWHLMTEQLDGGDILRQSRFHIGEKETSLTLNAKCYEAALDSFSELLEDFTQDRVRFTPQDHRLRRYFAKHRRPTAAGCIDWFQPAEAISALIRAMNYGPYANPLATPKLWLGAVPLVPGDADILSSHSGQPPGTVSQVDHDAITVTTGSSDMRLTQFTSLMGEPLEIADLVSQGLRRGTQLRSLSEAAASALTELNQALAPHEAFWARRLAGLERIEIPYAKRPLPYTALPHDSTSEYVPPATFLSRYPNAGDALLAAFTAYLSRIAGKSNFAIPSSRSQLEQQLQPGQGLFATHVPLRVQVPNQGDFQDFLKESRRELEIQERRGSFCLDIASRLPEVGRNCVDWYREPHHVAVHRVASPRHIQDTQDADLILLIPDDARTVSWSFRSDVFDAESIARMQHQFSALLNDIASATKDLAELSVLSQRDRDLVFQEWNQTDTAYDRHSTIHEQFELQAARTPTSSALAYRDKQLNYATLNARSNQLAHYLGSQGIGPGRLVGVLMDRCDDMVVAMMGILKAGAAYVPLDPAYPVDRLEYMVKDSAVSAIVSHDKFSGFLPGISTPLIAVDALGDGLRNQPDTAPTVEMTSADLAYVIYTSGSTGKPKGVMVEHRNAVNFFAGMDERLDCDPPGTWLAVTSISFDISVLEIFWTLARGFTVVLYGAEDQRKSATPRSSKLEQPIGFSLFYFASDESAPSEDKYELLLDGARFADRNGFEAVWTPERHFHAFGGLYPSPAVASAAIAAVTKKVKIRAGSCVLPLHSPIRVAEEWSLVDNLSQGRVGISFASGWQPDDFVIAPQNYEKRHELLYEGIETVRALWRGESRTFAGPIKDSQVRILPRPVQPELPVWVTAAGNPETFRAAGRIGAHMLTHLLGQSIEELSEKLTIYRQAWREAGHPGDPHVTLMLHTFVADDESFVRQQVHQPLKNYLRSATNLVKQHASSFPAFKNANRDGIDQVFQNLSEQDMEALLEHSFERYYETSGLFGTPQSCLETVDRLKRIGVDEIACLIDFGIPSKVVLEHLGMLNELRQMANQAPSLPDEAHSIPALLRDHEVTHLQCTPSMAIMLVKNGPARERLRHLRNMMVGGEPFPTELAAELLELVPGRIMNMYGPTETTVWSSTQVVHSARNGIPIGTPIANTKIYIMDPRLEPLPPGVPGELMIGGDGVVRGYLNRPDLTAERFVPNPFQPEGRLYRTGDLACWRSDGVLEFLGRLDNQVKLRGHRIELGEIESVLARHEAVQQCAVVSREDTPGDKRLVGYVIPQVGRPIDASALREFLKQELPEFMIPSVFVPLESFPLTPNQKVDRKRLPAPASEHHDAETDYVAPRNATEECLAGFFAEALGRHRIGIHSSFFELGGDSLSAVDVFLKIQQQFHVELPLFMLFQRPTVAELAAELEKSLGGKTEQDELQQYRQLIESELF